MIVDEEFTEPKKTNITIAQTVLFNSEENHLHLQSYQISLSYVRLFMLAQNCALPEGQKLICFKLLSR